MPDLLAQLDIRGPLVLQVQLVPQDQRFGHEPTRANKSMYDYPFLSQGPGGKPGLPGLAGRRGAKVSMTGELLYCGNTVLIVMQGIAGGAGPSGSPGSPGNNVRQKRIASKWFQLLLVIYREMMVQLGLLVDMVVL